MIKKFGVYATHITENKDLFINEISILKEYQNKGIEKAILKEIDSKRKIYIS